jgi:hypothetical protein
LKKKQLPNLVTLIKSAADHGSEDGSKTGNGSGEGSSAEAGGGEAVSDLMAIFEPPFRSGEKFSEKNFVLQLRASCQQKNCSSQSYVQS